MASNRARQLWESGIPLHDAWRHFASDADQKLLDELPLAMDAMAQFASDNTGGGIKALLDASALGVGAAKARLDAKNRLREELLTDLFNEQLVAVGFRERPSLGSAPVTIDAEHFDLGIADWEQSKFEANGRVWNRVKVGALEVPTIPKVPSSREAIEAAIYALIGKNAEYATAPGKIRCDAVRSEIGQEYIPGNGLSDQNIERHFVRICGIKRISKN